MSYTTVLSVKQNEISESIRELRNSHGSAPVIWNEMCKKYFGTEDHAYMHGNILDLLWPRYKDLSIPKHQRAVLMMTYDRARVFKDNYALAVRIKRKQLHGEFANHG